MVALAASPRVLRDGPFLSADALTEWLATLGDLNRYAEFAAAVCDLAQAGASPELAVVLVLRRAGEEAAAVQSGEGLSK